MQTKTITKTFLSIAIVAGTIFCVPVLAADSSRTVTITGHVDESITVRQEGTEVFVGTNFNSGVTIFQNGNIVRLDKPSETLVDSKENTIISPNI